MAEGWSGAGANAPVGARLFGGWGWGTRPGTSPSAAASAERERILRLYGMLPTATPSVPLAPPPTGGMMPTLDYGAPLPVEALPPVPILPEPETRRAPASVPPNVDGSSATRTPAQAPQESGRRIPHGTASALAWRDLLGSTAASLWGAAGRLPALPGPPGAVGAERLAPLARDAQVAEPSPYMVPEPAALPEPPAEMPPPPEAGPVTTADAMAGVTRGQPYARLAQQDPNYDAVMQAYMDSAPKPVEEDPNERIMRLVASALAGAGPGELGGLGAVSGLAAGYAREGDRSLARRERDETERRRFQQGLAGLMGEQETARWQQGLARAGFDRTSQNYEQSEALQREGLAIQRENAGLSGLLTRMRIQDLARRGGAGVDASEMLSRALPEIVRNSAPLTVTTNGRVQQLMLPVPPQYVRPGRGQAAPTGITPMTPADARRHVTESLMMQPGYATSPQSLARAVDGVLSQMYMTGIMGLPEAERRSIFGQAHRWYESRPRANSTELND